MLRSLLLTTTLAAVVVPAAAQVTVTIDADADTSIYSESQNSNGAGTQLFHGRNSAGNLRRAMLRFPIDDVVPEGATITAVEFEIDVNFSNSNNQTHRLHRLEASWEEGGAQGSGSGGPSAVGEATWFWRRYLVDPWVVAGGDFSATPSAVFNLFSSGRQTVPSTADLVADVQGWLDAPSSNFGWILIGNEVTNTTAYRSDSRENASQAPSVRVTFEWPSIAAPYGLACAPFDLETVGLPALGNLAFAIDLQPALTVVGQSVLFGSAPLTSPLLISNCLLHLDPVGIFGAVATDPNGTLAIPLPATSTNLLGSRLYVQGAAVATFSNGLVMTNGMLLQVGN